MPNNHQDPIEIALGHETFHAVVVVRFVETYQEHRNAVPIEQIALAVPMALHEPTRRLLRGNRKSTLLGLVGKAQNLRDAALEAARRWHADVLRAVGLLLRTGILALDGNDNVSMKSAINIRSVRDTDGAISKSGILGHVFGKIGNTKTVLSILEVRL